MTVPHAARPLPAASTQAALQTLRARGLRISASRRLVVEALFAADGPASAEEIAGGLGGRLPESDLASVYRNLDTLEAAGLVRHFHLGHGAGRYALSGRHEHGYAVCEACGAHRALDADTVARLSATIHAACGYDTSLLHFPVVGRCPACQPDPPSLPEVPDARS